MSIDDKLNQLYVFPISDSDRAGHWNAIKLNAFIYPIGE